MGNKEIEIKLKLREEEYSQILNIMRKRGKFIREQHQIDEYYSPADKSFYDAGDRCLRIRTENSRSILSYKQIHNENTVQQYIEEYETLIGDLKMTVCILNALNFVREIVIDKHRIEYMLPDNILVAMDCVKDLGYFIELENKNESETPETRNDCLINLIRELGIDSTKRNNEGYSNMMFKMKKGAK